MSPDADQKLYSIDIGYACAGVIVERGIVTRAAPIFRWALGKPWEVFEKWVMSKNGTITPVEITPD